MANLQQMNISFDAEQDRLLLKLRASDNSEIRLWITRRYLKLLWGVIRQMAESLSGANVHEEPETRDAVVAFAHEQAVSRTDFNTPYEEQDLNHPLGDAPVLVSKIHRRPGPGNTETLRLSPQKGKGIELTCDTNMLHSICQLLVDGVKKTDWDIQLRLFSQNPALGQTSPTPITRH